MADWWEEAGDSSDVRKSRLRLIYDSLDDMTVRKDTVKVGIYNLSREEYNSMKSVARELNTAEWRAFSKIAILGAARVYQYICDRNILELDTLQRKLSIVTKTALDVNIEPPSSIFVSGYKMYKPRIPWAFKDWLDGNVVKVVDFSESTSLRLCYLIGISRYEEVEGVSLPNSIVSVSEGVEEKFADYVARLYDEYCKLIMWYFITEGDVLESLDLEREIGKESLKLYKEVISKYDKSL